MKGYTIDCNYIVRVSDLMKKVELPRPRKRMTGDAEFLPIISVEVEI